MNKEDMRGGKTQQQQYQKYYSGIIHYTLSMYSSITQLLEQTGKGNILINTPFVSFTNWCHLHHNLK